MSHPENGFKPNETEIGKVTPFVIRGHHLRIFARLIAGPYDPVTLAEEQRGINSLTYMNSKKYSRDLVGKTDAEGDQYEKSAEDVFRRFVQLSSSAPIELVEGMKDEICSNCAIIGNHCSVKDQSSYDKLSKKVLRRKKKDVVAEDGANIDNFLAFVQQTGEESAAAYTIEEKIAKFTDAPAEKVRVIRTNAGLVRAYLGTYTPIGNKLYPTLFTK